MVHVNANLDLKTFEVIDTGRLNETLEDLSDDLLYITFIARDRDFYNKIKKYGEETHLWVVLPYEEVLSTNNIDLLALKHLFNQIELLGLSQQDSIKAKLLAKIERLQSSTSN